MKKLFEENGDLFADSWNFGPRQFEDKNVLDVVKYLMDSWKGSYEILKTKGKLHETGMLHLDCSKSYHQLIWQPIFRINEALDFTVEWYKRYYEEKMNPYDLCVDQIENYMELLKKRWVSV